MSLKYVFLSFLIFSFSILAKETGELQILSYLDGLPSPVKEIIIDGESKVSIDNSGQLLKELKVGSHFFEIKIGEKIESVAFTIAPNEITQVNLNLFSNEKLEYDLNDPEYIDKKNIQNLPKARFSLNVKEKNKGNINNAKVYISGQTKVFSTDQNGNLDIDLPIGKYTVSVVSGKFNTEILKFDLEENKVMTKRVAMTPAGLELEEFVVVAPLVGGSLQALIEVRKNSDRVADVIGSEQMSKSGDSDAGSSLRRVTGITLVDGKYVYVRGLGERYSSILMNQSTLPSPDPSRKVIPLDIFPSGILENMVIQKSYSPDLPGEFGGGTVILNTKNIPDTFEAKVSLSSSYQSGPSQHQTYAGGSRDWLGMDDGTRSLPFSIAEATSGTNKITKQNQLNPNGETGEQLAVFGKSLNNDYDLDKTRQGPPPSMNISVGDRFFYRGNKFGYFTSLMYSNMWVSEDSKRIRYEEELSGLVPVREDTIRESTHTIKLGGMFNTGFEFGKNHKINLNTILLRKSTNRIRNEFRDEDDINVRTTLFEWSERQLFSQIFKGEHTLDDKDFGINWLYSFSQAENSRPDERDYRYLYNNDLQTYIFDNTVGSNNRLWTDLTDRNHNAQLDFKVPLLRSKSFKIKMKTGLAYTYKDRNSDGERFQFRVDDSVDTFDETTGKALTLNQIINEDNINDGTVELQNTTLATDEYSASQRIRAGYIDSEIALGEWLTYNMGMRYERSQQIVKTANIITKDPEDVSLEMIDYLPVYSATIRFPLDIQFRLGYSETVSRPDFKELSNTPYFDNQRDEFVRGNTQLQGTVIDNYDARIEWYFGKKENVSLGVFRKDFSNPIENVIVANESTFANIPTAQNTGLEFEFRKNLGFVGMNDLSFSGNAAFIRSEVNVGDQPIDGLTSANRPMQGQSPYVLNANLEYDNESLGTQATALYNVFGRRISEVGSNTLPDIYERPFHQLDFVFSQKFGRKTKFNFRARNIINPEARRVQRDQVTEVFRKGRAFSAGVTIKL